MKAYLLIILADIFLASDFVLQKKYQKKAGTGIYAGLLFNMLSGLFAGILFWVQNKCTVHITMYSFIMAFLMSGLCSAYMMIGFRILKMGTMSFYTLFLMTGGMLVPYIWGVAFLEEPLNIKRIVGILLLIVSISAAHFEKGRWNRKMLLLCMAVFFLNGFVSVVSKLHQINTSGQAVATTDFLVLCGIARFLISGVLLLFCRKKDHTDESFQVKRVIPIIAASAAVGGISSLCQLTGAKDIPATVLYPLVTGGSVLLSFAAGCLFFREKASWRQWISALICFAGTCLFV